MIDELGWASRFGALDWGIVGAYLLATVALGLWVNRYVRGMSDFVVAGRTLGPSLSVASMIGGELGLVTVMYSAQKGFTGGFAAFHIGLVAGLVTLFVGLSGFLVVRLRELGVLTIPEFYERRFGRGVRVLGGLILALGGILNMGMFLKAGALFVTGLTGLHDTVWVNVVMTALIALVLLYTTLGGMVSVVLTDYVQFVVLTFGLLLTAYLALRSVGWDALVETVRTVHGEAGFDPLQEEVFGPTYVLWMVFTAGLVSCAIWPTAVMRASSAESPAVVRKLYRWSSIGFAIRFVVPQFLGIAALAYFWRDPGARAVFFETGRPVGNPEVTMQAMPVFLSQVLPTGLIGLVGAGMLAAFMSTHDSYLLCWSSVLVQDVVAPLTGERLGARARVTLARALILAIGAFLLVWSLWYPLEQDLWDYMAVTGSIYFTGAFALLVGGLYWRRASRVGAYLALVAGGGSVCGLGFVRDVIGLEASITGAHVGLTVTGLAIVGMVAGSLAFPDRSDREGGTA